MNKETTRTEKSTPARAGAAARELIRRAKRASPAVGGASRRKFPAEEKIRILLEGMRGEESVAELCRREGIHPTIYYKWLKDFMEAGKAQLRRDGRRDATTEEVKQLRQETERLKELVAELSVSNLVLKKSLY